MKVLVTGATGFTGSWVVAELIKQGHQAECLVRSSSQTSHLPSSVKLHQGDLSDPASMKAAFRGADALINVASIGFGHAPGIIGAARECGLSRALFFSTTAVFTSLPAKSRAIRLEAEKQIKESSLDFTILRPTMIYGSSRDRNMCRLIRLINRWRVVPVFGSGRALQQPVYVEDLAHAVLDCLQAPETVGETYNLAGREALTFSSVIDTIARELGRKAFKIRLPARPAAAALGLCEKAGLSMPIKAEQVLRLEEDKAFSYAKATRDFGYEPRSFVQGIRSQLREMGLSPDSVV